ncbi:MAG: hypothetical protein M9939_00665 [Mesorhizobium sp.]|nr:hypothetical protein [Mesorhizobium sp.]MCO5159619.1 hypothetical protein [Mesorhizobium sp.]
MQVEKALRLQGLGTSQIDGVLLLLLLFAECRNAGAERFKTATDRRRIGGRNHAARTKRARLAQVIA